MSRYWFGVCIALLLSGQYETGWDDGFRQCHAMQNSEEQRQYHERFWDQRDREWEQEKDRGAAKAYRHN